MKTLLTNPYLISTQKVSDNLLAELIKPEINWHTIELIGRELVVLAGEAKREQVKQRREYILNWYGEG